MSLETIKCVSCLYDREREHILVIDKFKISRSKKTVIDLKKKKKKEKQ